MKGSLVSDIRTTGAWSFRCETAAHVYVAIREAKGGRGSTSVARRWACLGCNGLYWRLPKTLCGCLCNRETVGGVCRCTACWSCILFHGRSGFAVHLHPRSDTKWARAARGGRKYVISLAAAACCWHGWIRPRFSSHSLSISLLNDRFQFRLGLILLTDIVVFDLQRH